jgi:hypothetical protein
MWGPGPCMGSTWGFWWIFPVIGLLICLFFVIAVVRVLSGGGCFMCMGHHHENDETARLHREVEAKR